jgi:hypothetical protein
MRTILGMSALLLLGGGGCAVHEYPEHTYYQDQPAYYGDSGYWDRGQYHHYHHDRNDWRYREYDQHPQYSYHNYPYRY